MNKKTSIIIGLSTLFFVHEQALAYPTKIGFDCKQEQHGLFAATREGKSDILQLYLDNKCPLNIHDGRGFSLYDIASLKGQKETIQWLLSHDLAKEGQHSSAFYKLLQTGLRFLNHDAGVVDGRMNAATADGIKSFQKSIRQSPTGHPAISWLPIFDQQLTKKMQSKLNELGFKAGGVDGIIGAGTRSAMQAFRQERKMPRGEYPYIDDQLIYQLMMAENEANKKAIARREAQRAARQIAQQAAQQQEEARLRAEAQRRATERRQQAEAAAAAAEAKRLAEQKALEAEKNHHLEELAKRRTADEAATRALEAKIIQQQAEIQQKAAQQAAAERIARNQREADEAAALEKTKQLEAQQKVAEAERKRLEKVEQEKEAARKREAEMIAARARKAAEEARKAEELARKQAEEAALAAEKARSKAQTAFRDAERGKPVFALNSSKNTLLQEEGKKSSVVIKGQRTRTPGFRKVSGKLQLQGKGRELLGCSINETTLDVGWCHQYFPSGNGKQCQAVISNTGVVVSLTCK